MGNASESVYRGREGSGEAQILQGNAGLAQLLRNQQYAQQQAMYQQRLQYQMQQQRTQRDNSLMRTDFGEKNPGAFQREQTVKEANAVRNKYIDAYKSNPYHSGPDIESFIEGSGGEGSKGYASERKAKRAEVQKALDQYQKEVTKDPKRYDPAALSAHHDYLFSDVNPSTGKVADKDIEQINPDAVGNAAQHPSVANPHARIYDAVEPLIKHQMQYSVPGQVQQTPGGFMKVDQVGRTTFMRNMGTPENPKYEPGVGPEQVQFVLDADPSIEKRFMWDIAKDQVKAGKGNPEDIDQVNEVYKAIEHSHDPSIIAQVYAKTKKDLDRLQTESTTQKYISYGKQSETQKVAPTEDDYKITRDQVNSIGDAFNKGDVTKTHDLLRNLENKKYNGMYIMKAEPAIEGNAKNDIEKGRIKLTLKVGTAGGFAFRKDEKGTVITDPKSGLPLMDYNAPTKADATETIYLDPKNKSALFDLLKYNHPEKKAKQMGYNQSALSETPQDEDDPLGLLQ